MNHATTGMHYTLDLGANSEMDVKNVQYKYMYNCKRW